MVEMDLLRLLLWVVALRPPLPQRQLLLQQAGGKFLQLLIPALQARTQMQRSPVVHLHHQPPETVAIPVPLIQLPPLLQRQQ